MTKRCKVKNCKRLIFLLERCRSHYYYFKHRRYGKGIAEVGYYSKFLERNTISAKEYLFFKRLWQTLDMRGNAINHKKSIVERIMRKYLKSEGNRYDPV